MGTFPVISQHKATVLCAVVAIIGQIFIPFNTLAETNSDITVVQSIDVSAGSSTNISASWNQPTIAGNHLVAAITHNNNRDITGVPSGWEFRDSSSGREDLKYASWAIFEIADAPTRSGAENFVYSLGGDMSLVLYELSGVDSDSAPGGIKSFTGSSGTTPSMSIDTGSNDGLVLAVVGLNTNGKGLGSIATSGWTSFESTRAGNGYKSSSNLSTTESVEFTGTVSNSWRGAMLSYVAKPNPISVNDYQYKRDITIDASKVVGSDQANFPILVDITLDPTHIKTSTGHDVMFTDSSDTLLKFDLEAYDHSTGRWQGWVKIPQLSHTVDTQIHVYYGNPNLTRNRSSVKTWDEYGGVWSFNETSGGSGAFKDRTAHANNMSSVGSQLTYGVPGKITKALSRNGSTAELSRAITDKDMDNPAGDLMVMAWVKTNSDSQNGNAQLIWENAGRFRFYSTGNANWTWRNYQTSGTLAPLTGSTLSGNWQYVADRISAADAGSFAYLDGAQVNSSSTVSSYIGTNSQVAVLSSGTASQGADAAISHLMIINGDKGEGWIKTSYNNQNNPSDFLSLGAEQDMQAAQTKRLKITINHTKVASNVSNFPVYINMADFSSDFFASTNPDCGDIRVTTESDNEIPREIAACDTIAKTGELYFLAPNLSSTVDTIFYVSYGDQGVADYAVTDTYGRNAVWSAYEGVFHLNSSSFTDSTGNGHSPTNTGVTITSIGNRNVANFDGNSYLDFGNDMNMGLGDLSVSAYFQTTSSATQSVVAKSYYSGQDSRYALITTGGKVTSLLDFASYNSNVDGVEIINDGASHQAVSSYDRTANNELFIDGTSDGTTGISELSSNDFNSDNHFFIGTYNNTAGTSNNPSLNFNGNIYQVRVQRSVPGVDWYATDYANQISPETFYSVDFLSTGALATDIVNSGGTSVTNPAVTMSTMSSNFDCMNSNGTLGTASQRIRLSNTSSSPSWSLSLAATDGQAALWSNGSAVYDYNDLSGSPAGCASGTDSDTYAGLLGLNFGSATIAPQSGCSNTGVSLGSNAHFNEGTTDAIELMSASGSAPTSCYWDLMGVTLEQQIPEAQTPGNYSLNLTLTAVAN